jgi:serine protease inhibitor
MVKQKIVLFLSLFVTYAAYNQPILAKKDIPKHIEFMGNNEDFQPSIEEEEYIARPRFDYNFTWVGNLNDFSFKVLNQISRDSQKNICISSVSIAAVLNVVLQGSHGDTQEEIKNCLGLDKISPEGYSKAFKKFTDFSDYNFADLTLNMANSVWLKKELAIKPAFLSQMDTVLKVKLSNLGENDSENTQMINDWVNQKTRGMIPKIADNIKGDLILLNAIYFKGKWNKPFDAHLTKSKPFKCVSNPDKKVDMMMQKGHYLYLEDDEMQAVKIPYQDGNFDLIVILPKSQNGLKAVQETLTNQNWARWQRSFDRREGTIEIPKFKMDFNVEIDETLKEMGIKKAYSDDSEITEIANMPLIISKTVHKTAFEINEKGAEAAAVTMMVTMVGRAWVQEVIKPFHINVNHPFMFAIQERNSGLILFHGVVYEP